MFCGLALNFYALLYISEVLTESLSLSLLFVAAGSWLWLQREPRRLPSLLIGSAAVAAAVMIRPANLFLLGSWVIGCGIVFAPLLESRRGVVTASGRMMMVAFVFSAVFFPQLINNVRHWQQYTPLIASNLQDKQQHWGIDWLKYGTSVPPVTTAQIFYDNPFAKNTSVKELSPLRWYFDHPGRGVLTIALHLFNMTDQDLVFTYARDLHPWYRVPHTLLNHAVVGLGLLGFFLWWRSIVQRPERADLEAATALTILALSACAIYATTLVEMRFGLTLLSILFPCAVFAALRLVAMEKRSIKFAGVAFTVAYAVGGLLLSTWVRSQSIHLRLPHGAFDLKLAMVASGQGLPYPPDLLPNGAIFAHPPTLLTLDVPANARQLAFAYGFLPKAYSEGGATTGACFRVSAETANGPQLLHERCLRPTAVPADRGKMEVSMPLPDPRPGRVIFETMIGNGPEWDWVFWDDVSFPEELSN